MKFLLDRFAVNFILWHDLEKNNKNLSMWLHYNQQLDERWSILCPFWLSYLIKTRCCNQVIWYIFLKKIEKYNLLKKIGRSNFFHILKKLPFIRFLFDFRRIELLLWSGIFYGFFISPFIREVIIYFLY